MTRRRTHLVAGLALVTVLTGSPAPVAAYSVLTHEAMVDALWKDTIVPLLQRKFPKTSAGNLTNARAYAYGGSLIQDLGYYPFGSKLFSNLVHHVRAGDFVEALLTNARDVNEYAFAIGALAHYAGDIMGHGIAVNRAVPIMYPKLRAEHGDEVLYVDSPSRHVMVEFAFDVSQIAKGGYAADAYRDLIGFEVATPLLERAFRDTYGLELTALFRDADLAIGTYRRAVSTTIPEMTILAWRDKRDEIQTHTPGIQQSSFVYTLSREEYERAFGVEYRKPGLFSRLLVAIFKVLPKFGPFKPLAFEPLTADVERLFVDSFKASRERYARALAALARGRANLAEMDLDTGREPLRGANPLADKTFAELLKELAKGGFAGVPPPLRRTINAHYQERATHVRDPRQLSKDEKKAAKYLAALNGAATAGRQTE